MQKDLVLSSFSFAFVLTTAIPVLAAYPGDPASTDHVVTQEEVDAAKEAGVPIIDHLFGEKADLIRRFNRRESKFVRAGRTLRVPDGEVYEPLPEALSLEDVEGKHIVIVLDRQFLAAYEDGVRVMSFPAVTGKKGFETPRGSYAITRKDADHVSAKYPEPDGGWPMPWAIRFRGNAYWIHAGDMVGGPASHGCVRLFDKDAETLFGWAEIGTKVTVLKTLPEPLREKTAVCEDPLDEIVTLPIDEGLISSPPSP